MPAQSRFHSPFFKNLQPIPRSEAVPPQALLARCFETCISTSECQFIRSEMRPVEPHALHRQCQYHSQIFAQKVLSNSDSSPLLKWFCYDVSLELHFAIALLINITKPTTKAATLFDQLPDAPSHHRDLLIIPSHQLLIDLLSQLLIITYRAQLFSSCFEEAAIAFKKPSCPDSCRCKLFKDILNSLNRA